MPTEMEGIDVGLSWSSKEFVEGVNESVSAAHTLEGAMTGAYEGAEELQKQYDQLAGELARIKGDIDAISKKFDESAAAKGKDAAETRALAEELEYAHKAYQEISGALNDVTTAMSAQAQYSAQSSAGIEGIASNVARYTELLNANGDASDATRSKMESLIGQYRTQADAVNALETELAGMKAQWDAMNESSGSSHAFVIDDNMAQQIDDAKNKLAQLKTNLDKTSQSLTKESTAAKKAATDTQQYSKASKDATQNTNDLGDASAKSAVALATVSASTQKAVQLLTSAVQGGINAYNEATKAQNTLRGATQLMGESFSDAKQKGLELSADGLINDAEVSASIANLVNYGMTVEQAAESVALLKDSATYLRQANYSLGEAVVVTTQGIRQELSTLSDAAGVTENIGKMMDTYAKSLGKTAASLTQAERAQAAYEGIVRGTKGAVGDAARASDEFAGAQARNEAAAKRLALAYGEAVVPMMDTVTETQTMFMTVLTNITTAAPEAAAGLTAMAATAGGIITLASAFAALRKVLELIKAGGGIMGMLGGPVGTGIAIAVTAIAGIASVISTLNARREEAIKQNEENIRQLSSEVKELKSLKAEYEELSSKTELTSDEKARLLAVEKELETQYGVTIAGLTGVGDAYSATKIPLDEYIASKERELQLERDIQAARLSSELSDSKERYEGHARVAAEASAESYKNTAGKLMADAWEQAKNFYEDPGEGVMFPVPAIDVYYTNLILQLIKEDENFRKVMETTFNATGDELTRVIAEMFSGVGHSSEKYLQEYFSQFTSITPNRSALDENLIEAVDGMAAAEKEYNDKLEEIVDSVILSAELAGAEINDATKKLAQEFARGVAGIDSDMSTETLNTDLEDILAPILSDTALNAALRTIETRMKAIGEALASGLLDEETTSRYEADFERLSNEYISMLQAAVDNAIAIAERDFGGDLNISIDLASLAPSLDAYSSSLETATANTDAFDASLSNLSADMNLTDAAYNKMAAQVKKYEENLKAANEGVAQQNAAAKLKEYLEVVKRGEKGTADYKNAVAALRKEYPGMTGDIEDYIDVLEAGIQAENDAGAAKVAAARESSAAVKEAWDTLTAEMLAKVESGELSQAVYDEIMKAGQVLVNANIMPTISADYGNEGEFVMVPTDQFEDALALQNELYAARKIELDEYLTGLEKIRKEQELNAYEEMALDRQVQDARISDMEFRRQMGAATLEDEIALYQELISADDARAEAARLSLEERRELEQQLHELTTQQTDESLAADMERFNSWRDASNATYAEQIAWLEELAGKYGENSTALQVIIDLISSLDEESGWAAYGDQIDELTQAYTDGYISILDYVDGLIDLRDEVAALEDDTGAAAGVLKEVDKALDDVSGGMGKTQKSADSATKSMQRYNSIVESVGDQDATAKSMDALIKDLDRIGKMRAAYDTLNKYSDATAEARDSSKEFQNAVNYLADATGQNAAVIANDFASTLPFISAAEEEVYGVVASLYALGQMDPSSAAAQALFANIEGGAEAGLEAVNNLIAGLMAATGFTINPDGTVTGGTGNYSFTGGGKGGGGGSKGGGGGGGSGNKKLQEALDKLRYEVTMDIIDADAELKELERIRTAYAKTTAEKRDLDQQIYAAQQKLYQQEVENITYLRSMRQISAEEEHRLLLEAAELYAASDAQRKQAALEAFQREEEFRQKELDLRYKAISDQKDAGQISLKQELELLKEIEKAHVVTEEEIADIADRIRSLELEIRREAFDEELFMLNRRRDEDKITTRELIANLEELRGAYADNLELRKQMDEEIYAARRKLLEEQYDTVTEVADAILTALKNKYEEEKATEKAALEESKRYWKDWASTAKAQIKDTYDARIKALDATKEAEDRAAQDEADRRKIAELELQLAHERDAENRYKLEQELAKAIASMESRIAKQELADQKAALQAERDAELANVEAIADAAQSELDAQMDALEGYWDERLETQKLRGEAERILLADDQQKIIELLESYNKDYDAIGKSWGQKLVEGFGESLAHMAEQAKAQFQQVQATMEDALRNYEASVSPTSAGALAGNAIANPGSVTNIYVQGSANMTEAEFYELVQRVNRELALMG